MQCSTDETYNSFFVRKSRKRYGWEMPALRAMLSVDAPWRPRSANSTERGFENGLSPLFRRLPCACRLGHDAVVLTCFPGQDRRASRLFLPHAPARRLGASRSRGHRRRVRQRRRLGGSGGTERQPDDHGVAPGTERRRARAAGRSECGTGGTHPHLQEHARLTSTRPFPARSTRRHVHQRSTAAPGGPRHRHLPRRARQRRLHRDHRLRDRPEGPHRRLFPVPWRHLVWTRGSAAVEVGAVAEEEFVERLTGCCCAATPSRRRASATS